MRTKTVDAARGRWFDILRQLGVEERFLRNKHGPCPLCGGEDRFRFDDKDGNGTWYCNRCGAGAGTELVMKIRGVPFKEACGLIDPLVGQSAMHSERKKSDPRPRLVKIASESVRCEEGGEVWKYLRNRGLKVPPGVREHAGLSYFEEGNLSGRYPAMVSRMVKADGSKAVSLHITYLQSGSKAPVSAQKKMMTPDGTMAGCAIRLYPMAERMAIAEGIETAIAYSEMTGYPCWATTSANLLSQWVPPAGVKSIIVAGDNDANFVGQHHAYALADVLVRKGFAVDVHIPPNAGQDWCDVFNASADRPSPA